MLALLEFKFLTLCISCCAKFSGGNLLILNSFVCVLRILAGKITLLCE